MKDWLISELKAMSQPQDGARYALSLSQERIMLLERLPAGDTVLGEAKFGDATWDEDVTRLRERAGGRRGTARVDLLLPPDLTLSRVDRFPGDARKNLREAVWWRLDTISTQRPEDLCFDAASIDADPATVFLQVNVAISSKQTVEEALAFAKENGFKAQRVSSVASFDGFPQGPLFVRAARNRSDTYSLRRSAAAMVAACLVLALMGGARALIERGAAASEIEEQRITAEAAFSDAALLRDATLDLARRAATPATLRKERPLVVDTIETLSGVLPPQSFAERVVIQDTTIRVEGVAANADAVLSALEVSDAFETPRYAAPPIATEEGRGGRFVIEASLPMKESGQ
ncbi:MAG: hypothetical protein ACFB0F_07060 [Neomegalonema sp.]